MKLYAASISVVSVMMTFAMAAGCSDSRDVSYDPACLGNMRIGETFMLKADVFLLDANRDRSFFDSLQGPQLYLVAPDQQSYYVGGNRLPTIAQYERSHRPDNIRGPVAAGTNLTLRRIQYDDYLDAEAFYYLFAITTGPYRGEIVCLDELMIPRPQNAALPQAPDPQYMAPQR